MYLKLIRNKAKGNAITGRLVIDGRWFCNTLERKGYEILALCYRVAVTMSPRFKRLLPLVCGVPQTVGDKAKGDKAMRQGIRIHRGSKPEHSTGCILVLGDNELKTTQTTISQTNTVCDKENDSLARCDGGTAQMLSKLSLELNISPVVVGCRSAADVERELTSLILKAQNEHEEIILEVTDFTPGSQYGYDHPCEPELQKR
jgi:hypothetical protein